MKLIILRDNLKLGLDTVARAVGQNLNLPILGNVLIVTEGNQIRLAATNLELAITKIISGKVVEEGSVTAPHQILASIVANSTSERINIETTKQGNLLLKGDNYESNIQSSKSEEFPVISGVSERKEAVSVNSAVFREGLTRAVIASEASDLRPEISGVLLLGEINVLKLVATDSFRLAEVRISGQQFKNNLGGGFKFTIPLKTAQELTRILKDEGEASFYTEKNQFLFKTEDATLTSRLIEGSFPDYEAIIPKEIDTEVLVSRNELSGALKLSGAFASRTYDVRLKLKDKKVLEIYSSDNAVGENNYLIPAKINGPETEAVFNWRYLLDGLKGGSTEQVFLGLNGSERPAVIKNPEDESYLYILMPIKA